MSRPGGGDGDVGACGGGGGRTVVVGVKMGSPSRELLTWVLVKVAQPCDRVVAVHVLSNNEIVDRDGKSSLLSLVKAFDSVLAVYEGFCNLKQVDLKLKICRGTSVRKILVREAKSYEATTVIVGTARKKPAIRSQASLAKHCARKLPRNCCVLAVNNGKIMFQREASSLPRTITDPTGSSNPQSGSSLLAAMHQSLSMRLSEAQKDDEANRNLGKSQYLEQELLKLRSDRIANARKSACSICSSSRSVPNENPAAPAPEECSSCDGDEGNSMAIVPAPKEEAPPSSSLTILTKEMPELRPGWPLLRRAVLPDRQLANSASSSGISVVQWAMQLPSRQASSLSNSDHTESVCDPNGDESSNLDGENGAVVPVDAEIGSTVPPSSEHSWRTLPEELEGLHEKYSAILRLFEYHELVAATSNFMHENLIGRGGSSQVYRGCLPDGKELAVKILKPSEDVLKEFILEIEIITTLHHKNIISLFGFCFEDNNLLLVYDFLSRGSLEENLHGDKKDQFAFGWGERYKVATGVAEALNYLHNASDQPVIHRDVKSSNILLSDDFEPQLSDFGLAKWASSSSSHTICSDVAGTFGYLAPEYFMYGKVNEKIDVYAFGVVLLELLTGRKPINSDYPKGQESLVMWAKPILNGEKICELLDQTLVGNYECDQMERMVLTAKLCIRRTPQARPKMSFVLKLLQGDEDVTQWARLQVNTSGGSGVLDGASPHSNLLQSHINLALLDVDEDSLSMSSTEQGLSLEDYLKGRWSRSSSFD